MIRTSPSERYIRYLLCHPSNYSAEQVVDRCRQEGLLSLGVWYMNKLRGELRLPRVFRPYDAFHGPSLRWLTANRLYRLFHPDAAIKEAYKIREQARVKEFVETMLLSHAPHRPIKQALQRKGIEVSEAGIQAYQFYFWDVDAVSSTDMRALLQLEIDQIGDHPDPEVRAQHSALKRAHYNDPRKTAADLPFSPLAALVAQMRLGNLPAKMDVAKVLEAARAVGAVRAFEAAYMNGPADAGKFSDYAGGIARISEVIQGLINPDEALQEQLSTLTLRTDTLDVPLLKDVTGGHHTVETSPLENKEQIEEMDDDEEGGAIDGDADLGEGE